MRLLRVLRSLRTLKTSNSLMVLMESIGETTCPPTSVLIIILILFYIFAILFTELIGKASHFEDDGYIHERRVPRELSRSRCCRSSRWIRGPRRAATCR